MSAQEERAALRDLIDAWDRLGIYGAANVGRSQLLLVPRQWGDTQAVEIEREDFRAFMSALAVARRVVARGEDVPNADD